MCGEDCLIQGIDWYCHNELYDIYFARKQRAKCGPTADRLSCRISTKMDSQPCGGTIPNKPPQCVYSQLTWHEDSEHDIITNRLLIRIISVAYTVL